MKTPSPISIVNDWSWGCGSGLGCSSDCGRLLGKIITGDSSSSHLLCSSLPMSIVDDCSWDCGSDCGRLLEKTITGDSSSSLMMIDSSLPMSIVDDWRWRLGDSSPISISNDWDVRLSRATVDSSSASVCFSDGLVDGDNLPCSTTFFSLSSSSNILDNNTICTHNERDEFVKPWQNSWILHYKTIVQNDTYKSFKRIQSACCDIYFTLLHLYPHYLILNPHYQIQSDCFWFVYIYTE